MCMVSLYLLAILCCHTIDWDIFLRYWCLSQIYYYYYIKWSKHIDHIGLKISKSLVLCTVPTRRHFNLTIYS